MPSRKSHFRNCYVRLPSQCRKLYETSRTNFQNFIGYQPFKSIYRILDENSPLLKSTTVGCKAKILPLTNRPSSNFTPMCSALGGTQVRIYLTLAELLRTVQIIAFSKHASLVTHLSHSGENFPILSRNGLTALKIREEGKQSSFGRSKIC